MRNPAIDYNIYPTLLDAFAWYKKSDDEGALAEFLGKVNRVQSPPTDPMLRGIAFENLVDDLATGAGEFPDTRDLLRIPPGAACDLTVQVHDVECPAELLRAFANRVRGAVRQVEVEAFLDTEHGLVRIYGKMDELLADSAYDIKTTGKYEFPKYLHNFQHLLYLEALRPLGINSLTYLVTDFRDMYEEPYSWTQDGRDRLVGEVCHLIEFLERYRPRITDRKVFNQHEEPATA